MKVSELAGAELDVWAARAAGEGTPQVSRPGGSCYVQNGHTISSFRPSEEWRHGGPLIEQGAISLAAPDPLHQTWAAMTPFGKHKQEGATPLEAAMRCFVAAKFGEEVPSNAEPSGPARSAAK